MRHPNELCKRQEVIRSMRELPPVFFPIMNARHPLIALVLAVLAVPGPAHAVKVWRTEYREHQYHSISLSRSLERRGLRSEKLAAMPSSGPIRTFNNRGHGLKPYRDRLSFRGGKRSPINVLQRGNSGRGYARSPLTRRVS